jgi:hypothetical protein
MKNILLVLPVIGLLLTGCGKNSGSSSQGTNTAANTNAPSGYLGTLVDDKKSADKKIDVAYLNQAVQLFNVQEGRYPKTLDELTPNYVAKIPDAPIGFKIDYDPVKGEVKVVPQ